MEQDVESAAAAPGGSILFAALVGEEARAEVDRAVQLARLVDKARDSSAAIALQGLGQAAVLRRAARRGEAQRQAEAVARLRQCHVAGGSVLKVISSPLVRAWRSAPSLPAPPLSRALLPAAARRRRSPQRPRRCATAASPAQKHRAPSLGGARTAAPLWGVCAAIGFHLHHNSSLFASLRCTEDQLPRTCHRRSTQVGSPRTSCVPLRPPTLPSRTHGEPRRHGLRGAGVANREG